MASGVAQANFYLWGAWKSRAIREPFLTKKVAAPLRKVVLGETFIIALTEKGRVVSWGRDHRNGCLGLGTDEEGQAILSSELPQELPGLADVVDVQIGQDHVVALTGMGEVFSWGNGSRGQLGVNVKDRSGHLCNELEPTRVEELAGECITQIAVVQSSTFALSRTGTVYAWGDNRDNMLGLQDSAHDIVSQPTRISLVGDLPIRSLEVFEGRTIIAHVSAPEGSDDGWDFREGLEERGKKEEQDVFTGIEQMRKAMEKTQEWWSHMLNIRHGQPYDTPSDAAVGRGQEAAHVHSGRTSGADVQDDMSAELSKLQRAERHLDSLVKLAVQELREMQRLPGMRNVRFVLCMFIDECRLRREKVRCTISARQLVDAKRRTQEISAYSVLDFGSNVGEEIRKTIALTKELQQMLDDVRNVPSVDGLSQELKLTLMECLECKLQLHDTRVELLKEVKGKHSDPMLPALRIIKDRWNALKSLSLYGLYTGCESRCAEHGDSDDDHLAYLVKASNAQIDQMLQMDKDRIISHDALVPALCYELLRENAELRKMNNTFLLHVLLVYKGAQLKRLVPEHLQHSLGDVGPHAPRGGA